MAGFRINRQAIRQMTKEIEREFAKNPVRVPLEADPQGLGWELPAATTVNNYHGPIVTVNGDGAQVAWDNDRVRQSHERIEHVAPGYEALAHLVTDMLASLSRFGLQPNDEADFRHSAGELLEQVTVAEPDAGIIRRAVGVMKGVLAPVALGVGDAVSNETSEIVTGLIGALGQALPS